MGSRNGYTPSLAADSDSEQRTTSFPDAESAQTYRPGYLGPTSYAAGLPRDDYLNQSSHRRNSDGSDASDHELTFQHYISKSTRMRMTLDVLSSLRHICLIERLVLEYCESNQAGTVAAPIILNSLVSIKTTVEKFGLENTAPDAQLSTAILSNTMRPLEIPWSTEASSFHELFTGTKIRLEIIGLIVTIAARSMFFGLALDMWNGNDRRAIRPQFTNEMLRASTTCLELCMRLTTVNDLLLWLLYDNLLLTSIMCGDTSPPVWRRLGELATEIYALGIHREPRDIDIPIFLLESRRRVFCASYNLDKSIATFLGRPPRISWRHADVKLPLDLRDEDLAAAQPEFELACQNLDKDGWSTDGTHCRVSWIRLRCITGTFREEILDFSLEKLSEDTEPKLLDISRRCKQAWEALPAHLRYKPSCWDEDLPSGACLWLVIVYLTHLYNEFLIQKLLDKQPLTRNHPLLNVSMELLSTVLTLGQPRDRSFDSHRDFSYTILLYGIPSASVLVSALQEQARTGQAFPPQIARSEIIRNLSVLISNLESVARPGDGNYALCKKAAKVFTRIIDNVLDQGLVRNTHSDTPLDSLPAVGLDGLDSMDVMDLFDNMDWSAGGQWAF